MKLSGPHHWDQQGLRQVELAVDALKAALKPECSPADFRALMKIARRARRKAAEDFATGRVIRAALLRGFACPPSEPLGPS